MVDIARGLTHLPTRPPTPPRSDPGFERITQPNIDVNSVAKRADTALLDTPDGSPASSAEYFPDISGKSSKRLRFSAWTEYHKHPRNTKETKPNSSPKSLLPCREAKSLKSILKPYDRVTPQDGTRSTQVSTHEDFLTMLESATQQLASASRSARLDAYMTLNGCLKAYDDIPDPQALAEKMGLLSHFIRRDISTHLTKTDLADNSLTSQALKLLSTVLWMPKLAGTVPEELCTFIMEISICSLQKQDTPKQIVTHLMQLLATQKFRPKIMNSDRASRLLEVLEDVTDRVKGNSVIAQRIVIYQRLLVQARAVMIFRVSEWMDHLFSGMLSDIKEIRCRAISFGSDAGLALGTTLSVSRAAMDVFTRESTQGKKYDEIFSARLNGLLSSKEEKVYVPQILSVVVLFLRSRDRQIERWEYTKIWLSIVQKCFNSSDSSVKFQANIAWNKLIFAVNPDRSTSSSFVRMLRQPVLSQLDRRSEDKQSKAARQIACASYCNLLYYALRPSATHVQLDHYWEPYVRDIIHNGLTASKNDVDYACRVLTTLFGDGQMSIWNENKANENGPIKPEELPRIDPKWIRSRAAMVIKIFDLIFSTVATQEDHKSREWGSEHWVIRAWQAFCKAIGEAGNKEVKVPMECMEAIAAILSMLQRLWVQWCLNLENISKPPILVSMQRAHLIIKTAIAKIGRIPFTEKRLVCNSQNAFEAAETPSGTSRSSRHESTLRSPMAHVLELLQPSTQDDLTAGVYGRIAEDLIRVSLSTRSSRAFRFKNLRDWTQLMSFDETIHLKSNITVWKVIAGLARESLPLKKISNGSSDSPSLVGNEFRDITKILDMGVRTRSPEITLLWNTLCQELVHLIRREIGEGGVVLAATEPLAAMLVREQFIEHPEFLLSCACEIMEFTLWPESRHALEQARRALWDTADQGHKSTSFDPFDHFYALINNTLKISYDMRSLPLELRIRALSAIEALLRLCPSSLKAIFLKHIQHGIGVWLEDAARTLTESVDRELKVAVKRIWARVAIELEDLHHSDSMLLQMLEPLLLSGFRSRHQRILNDSIVFWNNTFGNAENLEYPTALRNVLLNVRSITEIHLPGLSVDEAFEEPSALFSFIKSPKVVDPPEIENDLILQQVDNQVLRSGATHAADGSIGIRRGSIEDSKAATLRSMSISPNYSGERVVGQTTPRRPLRHDDSQIKFAAVYSSPLGSDGQSSQLLTDCQKEVAERQRLETTAIFPGLRSSPQQTAHVIERHLPKLSLTSDRHSHINVQEDSPVLPPLEALDGFAGTSPTTRSSQNRIELHGEENDPPSSPQPAESKAESIFCHPCSISPSDSRTGAYSSAERTLEKTPPEVRNIMQHLSTGVEGNQEIFADTIPEWEDKNCKSLLPDTLPFFDVPSNASEARDVSDLDVFVDAPTSPIESNLSVFHNKHCVPVRREIDMEFRRPPPTVSECSGEYITSTNSAPAKPYATTSSDLSVSGILDKESLGSMDKPSQGLFIGKISNCADIENGRKRKSTSASPKSSPKKRKGRSPRKKVQVLIERRRTTPAEEEVLDCIVVNTTTQKRIAHPLSQEVLPGPSSSPSDLSRSINTPKPERKPGRRERRSMVEPPSSQDCAHSTSRKRKDLKDHGQGEREESLEGSSVAPMSKKGRTGRYNQTQMISNEIPQDISLQKIDPHGYASISRSTKPLVLTGGDGKMGHEVTECVKSSSEQDTGDTSSESLFLQTSEGSQSLSIDSAISAEVSDQMKEREQVAVSGSPALPGADKLSSGSIQMNENASERVMRMQNSATDVDVTSGRHERGLDLGREMVRTLKQWVPQVKGLSLGEVEGREITDLLFDLARGVREAERRHTYS